MNNKPVYERILLKLSGEVLQGDQGYGIEPDIVNSLAKQIKEVKDLGIEIAIIIGGGNIFRGLSSTAFGMDRTSADHMGMLATIINGIALQDALEKIGIFCRVQSALEIARIAEPYIRRRATRHLEKGRVVIFVAGTGNPFFTTDTAAALRAAEIGADVILKATKVDGIYSQDPMKHTNAVRYDELSYLDVLSQNLKIMDAPAISLCMENKLPIIVFDLMEKDSIKQVVLGEKIGTIVK